MSHDATADAMAPNRPRRYVVAIIALTLACLAHGGAGAVGASNGAPTFEVGTELLVTDVAAARLVGYGTVGEHALELRLAAVSANVRVLVVAPDGSVAPFLGTFAEGRLVLMLADGATLDVADHLAHGDHDLVFVLPDGRRVLVPVEGREPTAQFGGSREATVDDALDDDRDGDRDGDRDDEGDDERDDDDDG